MKIKDMTKGQLLNELIKLRQLIAELEKSETEHKQVEEALKKSEQKFRSIFNNVIDGILLADIKNKKFYFGNKMIC